MTENNIMTENMCLLTKNYYTMDNVDNLSDHVPLENTWKYKNINNDNIYNESIVCHKNVEQ